MAMKTVLTLPGQGIGPKGAAGPSTSHVVSWLRSEMSAWAGGRSASTLGCARPRPTPRASITSSCGENSEGIYPGREGDLADLVKVMPDLSDRTGPKVKDYGTVGQFAGPPRIPLWTARISTRAPSASASMRKATGGTRATRP